MENKGLISMVSREVRKRVADWVRPELAPRRERLDYDRPKPIPRNPDSKFQAMKVGEYEYVEHPEHGLTPMGIVSIFAEAEEGNPERQCRLFRGIIETDAHLRNLVESRIAAVTGKEWLTQPGGSSTIEIEAAERLQVALRNLDGFQATMEHILEAVPFGYAFAEVVWKRVDGYFVPVHIANVPHRRFRFDRMQRPRLATSQFEFDGEPLTPGKWLQWCRTSDEIARAGLMRTATWYSYFKRVSWRDWLVFADRFGIPFVTGQYDEGTAPDEKDILRRAVREFGKEGAAVFSKMSDIIVTAVNSGESGSDGVHDAIIRAANNEMSKLMAGSTLTSDTGVAGSYAQASVHADRAFDLVQRDERGLASAIHAGICRPFVAYNYGPDVKAPLFAVRVVRQVDPVSRMKILTDAQEMGIELSVQQIRDEHNIKPPMNDSDRLGRLEDADAWARAMRDLSRAS